jgi:hypothetical protein
VALKGFTVDELHRCLESIAPVELEGMRLLKERPHFLFASEPIAREQLVEAVAELIDYTGRCAAASTALAGLAPVPLTVATVLEFGL